MVQNGPAMLFDDLPSGKLTQLLKMAIEIVDLPIKNWDCPQLCLFTRGYLQKHGDFPQLKSENVHGLYNRILYYLNDQFYYPCKTIHGNHFPFYYLNIDSNNERISHYISINIPFYPHMLWKKPHIIPLHKLYLLPEGAMLG